MSVNSSDHHVVHSGICSTSQVRNLISLGFLAVKPILTLPLCTFVIYLGFQRWRQQRSFKAESQSVIFTYHLVAMELFWGPEFVFYACGFYLNNKGMLFVGSYIFSMTFYGEMFFHMLTCVDWYLAVIHPMVYVRLRSTRGVKIRNICITSAWLLSNGLSCFQTDTTGEDTIFAMMSCLSVSIIIVTFCSLSVLCALIRPGPGELGEGKKKVNQLKQRAFHTITAISSVLWLWFVALFVGATLTQLPVVTSDVQCLLLASICWFNLPSSLLSPLLFLHRAGKLSFICFKKE